MVGYPLKLDGNLQFNMVLLNSGQEVGNFETDYFNILLYQQTN